MYVIQINIILIPFQKVTWKWTLTCIFMSMSYCKIKIKIDTNNDEP